jgi:hypothetical protein
MICITPSASDISCTTHLEGKPYATVLQTDPGRGTAVQQRLAVNGQSQAVATQRSGRVQISRHRRNDHISGGVAFARLGAGDAATAQVIDQPCQLDGARQDALARRKTINSFRTLRPGRQARLRPGLARMPVPIGARLKGVGRSGAGPKGSRIGLGGDVRQERPGAERAQFLPNDVLHRSNELPVLAPSSGLEGLLPSAGVPSTRPLDRRS